MQEPEQTPYQREEIPALPFFSIRYHNYLDKIDETLGSFSLGRLRWKFLHLSAADPNSDAPAVACTLKQV
jgi:hypothetical protein